MNREDLEELHYITPIANISSIMQHGILSHNRAEKLLEPPTSIAMAEIQERRRNKVVAGGSKKLHDFANLYFCARNPMMYLRRQRHSDLCVLRVSQNVLDIAETIITDQNAASGYVRFGRAPNALDMVDKDLVFADSWQSPDRVEYWRRKARKCAEVLVPNLVAPDYVLGVYVSGGESEQVVWAALQGIAPQMPVTINRHLFFC